MWVNPAQPPSVSRCAPQLPFPCVPYRPSKILLVQLHKHMKVAVNARDWTELRAALDTESALLGQGAKVGHFAVMLRRLSEIPQAQDKFWRYMELS